MTCLALLALPLWLWQDLLLAQWDGWWTRTQSKVQAEGVLQSSAPPRKCQLADGRLLYTTEPCPAGSRERGLQGGTVNVVAAPAAAGPASAASATPLLRRLAGPQETDALREKMMERAGAQ
ncbi:hypothetical protein HNQ51_002203 [Inhella inkyongensis]|uniref:DUF4124 domain-containing protein n=1 Tax=Inhella inkyongensis TaxID=392593 RepID=A0A840S7X1_9BURK|nr:hypothetical protein [Inhella inkyongensis]MBB5204884.1 hypothetical protein [Inhella inkyongensis]